MSYKKYRFIDLFIFLVIYLVLEFLIETAAKVWFPEQIFSVSLLLPISIIVMVRWEWHSVPNIIIYTIAFVLFTNRPGTLLQYGIYLIGSIGLILPILLLTNKRSDKIISKWYFTVFLVVGCFLLTNVFRGIGAMIFNNESIEIIFQYILTDSLNLLFGLVVILISRKANGLFINQKRYLISLEKERKEKEEEFL